jgi:hypothetical protein
MFASGALIFCRNVQVVLPAVSQEAGLLARVIVNTMHIEAIHQFLEATYHMRLVRIQRISRLDADLTCYHLVALGLQRSSFLAVSTSTFVGVQNRAEACIHRLCDKEGSACLCK